MLFNSLTFALFFVIVFSLYKVSKASFKLQNLLLLVSSYVFYGWWDSRFLFLIVFSTYADYVASLIIGNGSLKRKERIYSSLFILLSCFLFLAIQWNNISFNIYNFKFTITELFRFGAFERNVLIGTITFVAIINLLHPFYSSLKPEIRNKAFLILSIVVNIGLLGFFKYYNFFIDSFIEFSESVFHYRPNLFTLKIILPVGISFYTFQTMSYTIDVYRKQLSPSSNLIEFATYVSFFPQLVAGPIERGKHLLPQFRKPRLKLTKSQLQSALWLIFWGLFKKLVVADNMAVIVNDIFRPWDNGSLVMPENGLMIITGVLAFTFQIYGDFSGYTDIARGVAKLMGFDIMLNFKLPYFAISPSDFWKKWHISLSSWLKDYLYIPLGGSKKGKIRTYKNLMLTMLLGGLWHGAAWTFVIWGAFHGIILIIYRVLKIDTVYKNRNRWQSLLLILFMFILTCYGWLIFRSQNVSSISLFTKAIFVGSYSLTECSEYLAQFVKFGWFLLAIQFLQYFTKSIEPLPKLHWFIRLNILIYIAMALLTMGSEGNQEFIYFAF